MNWFERIFGFVEDGPSSVYRQLEVVGTQLVSKANGRSFEVGELTLPSLSWLRSSLADTVPSGRLRVRELVADVAELLQDPTNAQAIFQVASQFNLLEMTSPSVTPEQGITIYQHDRTQGPICAMACAAGTVYRNYFVEVAGQTGQRASSQLDGLQQVGERLGNKGDQFWKMSNGYALPFRSGLEQVDGLLAQLKEDELDEVRGALRVGLQTETEVTMPDCDQRVTQVYCSALPVAYCSFPKRNWERFGRLVLEAAYEATFAAAVKQVREGQASNQLFLTLLGGGAFGNPISWIIDALWRSCRKFADYDLDVSIVSYRKSEPRLAELCQQFG